ncbi:MAG: nucleoside hydrolase [Anaerolineaceae bacterium]|nr:nucleoside hydrolase [Anaerolineaceae bacterium]
MTKRKIIFDTDPGIDDAMAIFFALDCPELELIGLTTIFGNVHTAQATQNALHLLEVADRTDIPVAEGAANTLARAYRGPVPFVHGDDGLGNIDADAPSGKALDITAAQFIVEQIMAAPGEITLVPVGPLTNIALALRLEPKIVEAVKEVVIMGGNAFVPGNATPAAEANILNDPEAADVVFSAGWPLTMVGLDVTEKTNMTSEQLAQFGQSERNLAQYVAKMIHHYHEFHKQAYPGLDGIFIHDSSALVYLIVPELFETVQLPVAVALEGISRGKTWPAPRRQIPPWEGRTPVNICVNVDGEKSVALQLERSL